MKKNPINELSDDDENYVFSYDSSFTDDDNYDYDENADINCLLEKQRNYYISTGMTIHDTSSDESSWSEKFQSSSATSEKQSLSKNKINSKRNLFFYMK